MPQQQQSGRFGFFAGGRQRTAYHHGNLKESLLDAAESLIAMRGPTGIALSELARMAGVSPAAIYRHYADLHALIGAVAKRGFEAFASRLRSANAAAASRVQGLQAMGNAYLAFARERPGAYAAMFSGPMTYSDETIAKSGSEAFNALAEGLSGALQEAGIDSGEAFSLAIKIWAMAHGVATLTGAGRLSPAIGTTPESILHDGVEALLAAAQRKPPG